MSRLDQLVKGASPPTANLPFSASQTPSPPLRPAPYPEQHQHQQPATAPPDPLSTLPSSPPQIYLNLLILESSLRSQYLALRARRRQNTFFLLLLALWIAYFSYALFLRPREDGRGVGGSVYWVVEMGEKMALMGGVVTGILVWGTGQWERGVRWPRRWLGVANRGLRGMNAKIVVVRGKWWWEALSYLSFVFPYSSFFPAGTSFHYIETSSHEKPAHTTHTSTQHTHRRSRLSTVSSTSHPYDSDQESTTTPSTNTQPTIIEEDLAPGGNYIKLLLLPKSFSPAFRENWDEYRTDYWERENERRAALRSRIKEQQRALAKSQGGWLWWAGWRGWGSLKWIAGGGGGKRPGTPSSGHGHGHGHAHGHSQSSTTHFHHKEPSTGSSIKPSRRSNTPQLDPAAGIMTHSRTPSRSSTPNALSSDADEYSSKDRQRARRGSSATASGGEREKEREKRKGRKGRSGTGSGSFSAGSGNGRERAPSPLTRIEPQPPVPRDGG
ncbi:hypothetical protein FQN53_007167 [Emmonsiellopsis sp. PD_33]|nr:hypothetical protein FQN53_007167 [Emmonsiellopsis sp. PD_33]